MLLINVKQALVLCSLLCSATSLFSGAHEAHTKAAPAAAPSLFSDIVNHPGAYRAGLHITTSPDHTRLLVELRGTHNDHAVSLLGFELHLKDPAQRSWSLYTFNSPNAPTTQTAGCRSGHSRLPAANLPSTLTDSTRKDLLPE